MIRLAAPLAALLAALVGATGCAANTGEEPWRPGTQSPVVCDTDAPSVGPTPLRRLSRTQYGHAVEDLLGAPADLSSMLSDDERVGAFTSNASAPIDRTTLERYLDAADAVTAATDLEAFDDCDRLTEEPADCAQRFVELVGFRLYRRPVDPTEAHRLLGLYDEYGQTDHAEGLRMMLRAMLVSPFFLYHDDYRTSGEAEGNRVPLDPFALAARLAFFLWDSAPDDELLAAADEGRLSTADDVEAQARRMLDDARAARGIGRFHREWLDISDIPSDTRDPAYYPTFDPALAQAMIAETEAFADHVIRQGDGSLTTLLTARWSIVPEGLQSHYGLPAGTPTDTPVEVDPSQRAGILTHASVLTGGGHFQVSSLTLRGKLIRERVLCQELPDPPPGVDTTPPTLDRNATTRERFEAHVASPSCAGCHEQTDPIGFAFEHFDAVGAWREVENGTPIDATGELDLTDVDGQVEGAAELADRLAESRLVERCVARQWFRYALGRSETEADGCSLQALFDAMEAEDNLRQLIVAITTSDSFRYRFAQEAP